MRREARQREMEEIARLSEGKETMRMIEHLKESLRISQEREEQMRANQSSALTHTVTELTTALKDRDEELTALRMKMMMRVKEEEAAASSSTALIPILSTPTLIASHDLAAAAALKFTRIRHASRM